MFFSDPDGGDDIIITAHDSNRPRRKDMKDMKKMVNDRISKNLKHYLAFEWKDRKGRVMSRVQKARIVINESDCNTQTNAMDCGVFTCMFAFAVCHQMDVKRFDQKHAPAFRKHIFTSIMAKKLQDIIEYPTVDKHLTVTL